MHVRFGDRKAGDNGRDSELLEKRHYWQGTSASQKQRRLAEGVSERVTRGKERRCVDSDPAWVAGREFRHLEFGGFRQVLAQEGLELRGELWWGRFRREPHGEVRLGFRDHDRLLLKGRSAGDPVDVE